MAYDNEMPHLGGATISTRLTARLIKELREGEFAKCERLPAEIELAEQFGVSRSVVRDVLANLEREGFVERARGIGTIIHRDIVQLNNRLDLKFEYNDLVRGLGMRPSTDKVRFYKKQADEQLAERLDLDLGAPVLVCEKRILASGTPVIYSVDQIPARLFGDKKVEEIDWSAPVFDILEKYCNIAVDTDIAKLTAIKGPPYVRWMLETATDEALIMIDEVGYYKLSRPILQTHGYYTNFFDFTILRRKF